MKKRFLALAIALGSIFVVPTISYAEEDYSYLEEMSVKELKALDAAIHQILGDNQETAEEVTDENVYETLSKEEKDFVDMFVTWAAPVFYVPETLEVTYVTYFDLDTLGPTWDVDIRYDTTSGGKSIKNVYLIKNYEYIMEGAGVNRYGDKGDYDLDVINKAIKEKMK